MLLQESEIPSMGSTVLIKSAACHQYPVAKLVFKFRINIFLRFSNKKETLISDDFVDILKNLLLDEKLNNINEFFLNQRNQK